MQKRSRQPSVLGGSMIIAGTAIGAGMLALPITSAGMWFYWSMGVMALTWAMMLLSSQAILEVNLRYEPGASFHTLVKDLLGPVWSIVNGISVAFVLYTLVYAYISGGGSIVSHAVEATGGFTPSRLLCGSIFFLLMTACVWWSTWIVDRLSVIMVIGMVVAFGLSMTGMLSRLRFDELLVGGQGEGSFLFIWAALSTYLTSFCFHASVPSLVKYFGNDASSVNRCLIRGTLIALSCYVIWLITTDGTISREQFKVVIAAGGNVGDLVHEAGVNLNSGFILRALEAFSFLAIASSFLGAGLGLFDYMADLCGFGDDRAGRTKTAAVTFLPPLVFWTVYPNGFLPAIAWAGLAAAIWSVIVPALLLRASRQRGGHDIFITPGGNLLAPLLLLYGCVTAVCHVLVVFNVLPTYH